MNSSGSKIVKFTRDPSDTLHVNGDINISTSKKYKSNGVNIATTDTTYTFSDPVLQTTGTTISLNTDLTTLNSISSVINTDLKLKSIGTGDILLKANVTFNTIGKIHLSRIDDDSIHFNTI